jgi:hypothetical protein
MVARSAGPNDGTGLGAVGTGVFPFPLLPLALPPLGEEVNEGAMD